MHEVSVVPSPSPLLSIHPCLHPRNRLKPPRVCTCVRTCACVCAGPELVLKMVRVRCVI